MAVIVVGGQARNVGKTSVITGLISAMPELRWTAMKITGHEHELSLPEDHSVVDVYAECDAASGTDTARFLAAGAVRSLLVRMQAGRLNQAMTQIRSELDRAENAILESNSVMQYLNPDLYLLVLNAETADFKNSARLFLGRADALLVHAPGQRTDPNWEDIHWEGVPAPSIENKPRFVIAPPDFTNEELVKFVRESLTKSTG